MKTNAMTSPLLPGAVLAAALAAPVAAQERKFTCTLTRDCASGGQCERKPEAEHLTVPFTTYSSDALLYLPGAAPVYLLPGQHDRKKLIMRYAGEDSAGTLHGLEYGATGLCQITIGDRVRSGYSRTAQ